MYVSPVGQFDVREGGLQRHVHGLGDLPELYACPEEGREEDDHRGLAVDQVEQDHQLAAGVDDDTESGSHGRG